MADLYTQTLLRANASRAPEPMVSSLGNTQGDNSFTPTIAAKGQSQLGQTLSTPPVDNLAHYNTAGYIEKYGPINIAHGDHLTDEFKLPTHPTFSTGSMYHSPTTPGGEWKSGGSEGNRWEFTPSAHNLTVNTPDQLSSYFTTQERKNSFVKLPNGQMTEGTL